MSRAVKLLRREIDAVCNAPNPDQRDKATIHCLRDTLCNRLREAGVDLETIRKLLRHASTSMTLKYAYCVCSGES
jgi:site-specific recombinase XerD